MTKTKTVTLKIPEDMLLDLEQLRKSLKVQDNSKAIRFCILFTLVTVEKLDTEKITEALAIAFGETFFNDNNK